MKSEEHKLRILRRLMEESDELYFTVPKTVEQIVDEINYELDKTLTPSADSDKILRHREDAHHIEGIRKITKKLVKRYGSIYRTLIKSAAEQHVIDDMGFLYSKKDYKAPYFWPKWQAQHEVQCSWL